MIHEGTLEEDMANMEKCRAERMDISSYSEEKSLQDPAGCKDMAETPEIPLPYKPVDSLVVQLINASMELLEYRYGITTIQKSDYDLISEHAFFLCDSAQVLEPEDVDLDAVYECFNDAEVNERMIEVEEQRSPKKERGSNVSGKRENRDRGYYDGCNVTGSFRRTDALKRNVLCVEENHMEIESQNLENFFTIL